jgi:hypothetical protein
LGVYDVELPSTANAIDTFAELSGHELIQFVEVNTIGRFEESKK